MKNSEDKEDQYEVDAFEDIDHTDAYLDFELDELMIFRMTVMILISGDYVHLHHDMLNHRP